jgi:hypothetical protein
VKVLAVLGVQVTHGLAVVKALHPQAKLPAQHENACESGEREENVDEVFHVGFFLG